MLNVSIIIINYNSFGLLKDCLESIFNFTVDFNYEIILIDNASTEGDVEEVTKKFENIKLIKNKKNLGFAAANNQGIKIAKGKYILLLNNDTEFQEDSISKVYDFAESTSEKLFIGCKLLNKDGSHQESVADFPTLLNTFMESFFLYKLFPKKKNFNKFHLNYKSTYTPTETDVIKGAFMFCDTKSIKKLGGFDERFFFYSEEVDLCKRFKDEGGKVIYYPKTSIYHFEGSGSSNNLWFRFKNLGIAKIQYFQKHFKGIKFFLIVAIHYIGIILRIPFYLITGLFGLNKFQILKSFYFFRQLFVYPKNIFND
ncbi:MAG: glycosyltransferase family 2 protein [Ignavibacteriae bacterium]|nr:glycosyltransferase family 2 protein [Ignavibacteriota bacterium]NOG97545.1 glycosyltransferase family 2 protein [Ignavibacteriota bacterium]